ncbi:MAG: hypothetical protein LUI07_04105 [Lachnospiraceae bacterium]|nr:hypothetical protein [Lachnospiraceae bacterium]
MTENGFRIVKDDSRTPGTTVCRDGVHFGFYASSGEPSLVLYKKGSEEIVSEVAFPKPTVPGNFYTMKVKLPAEQYEYNFRDGRRLSQIRMPEESRAGRSMGRCRLFPHMVSVGLLSPEAIAGGMPRFRIFLSAMR